MPIISPGGGGAGGLSALFSTTLSGAAATIDTGASGIGAGFTNLLVIAYVQVSSASGVVNMNMTLNGDGGAHYDTQTVLSNASSVAAAGAAAATSIVIPVHDTGGTANYTSSLHISIPRYLNTTFNKVGTVTVGTIDGTTTNNRNGVITFGWRSTAAINQLTLTPASGNFTTGSYLAVYGI